MMKKKKLLALIFIAVIAVFSLSFLPFWSFDFSLKVGALNEYPGLMLFFMFDLLGIIFSIVSVVGNVLLFIHIYKNDFSIPKDERARIAEEKARERAEQKKQAKIEKLKTELEKIEND